MFYILVILQIFVILFILGTLYTLIRGDSTHAQKMMIYFLTSSLLHNIGYLLELTSTNLEAAMTAVKVEYLGCSLFPLFFMMFIIHYCGREENKLLELFLIFIDCIVLGLVWTSPLHNLYYTKMLFSESGLYPHLELSYGPGFLLYTAFAVLIPFTIVIYVLIASYRKERNPKKHKSLQYVILLSAACFGVFVLYALRILPIPHYDPTPLMTGFILVLMIKAVWNRKDYDLIRVAANTVLDTLNDCVITLNEFEEILSFNDAAIFIFPDITMHRNIRNVTNFPASLFDSKQSDKFQIGNKHYEGHITTLQDVDKDIRGYSILIVDTTETYEYIQKINAMRLDAEKANHAKSDFLANMSHEIRTPMNAIIGLSELIIEESAGRKLYNYACDIKDAAINLLSIINDILDLSKVESGKMTLTEDKYYLQLLIEDTINLVRFSAMQKGLKMNLDLDDSLPHQLCGDEGRIRQILTNLLNNAIKFTKKGHVSLIVKGICQEDGSIELILTVEDTGIGIKENDLKVIFDAFEQVDMKKNRSTEGSGLGLSITKNLAELMQGSVQVESEYGKGTRFTVRIRQKIIDSRSIREASISRKALEKGDIRKFTCRDYRILIVDDNVINRKVAHEMAARYEAIIDEADNGRSAIALAEEHDYDMILMDHMMPEMDGIEAARIILDNCKASGHVPIMIALTANAIQGAREMYLDNGFQDFLSKPFDRAQLHAIFSKWIPEDRKEYSHDETAYYNSKEAQPAISKDDLSPLQMTGVDVIAAAHKHGSIDNYLELLDLFYTDGMQKTALLAELASCGDKKRYAVEVHALKSSAANIGADVLSSMAKQHEEAADRSDDAWIKNHFESLISCYKNILSEIRRVLEQQSYGQFKGTDNAALSPIDSPKLHTFLDGILRSVETFHSKEATAKLENLLGYALPDQVREELKQVHTMLKMYEDDEAEEKLKEIIGNLPD